MRHASSYPRSRQIDRDLLRRMRTRDHCRDAQRLTQVGAHSARRARRHVRRRDADARRALHARDIERRGHPEFTPRCVQPSAGRYPSRRAHAGTPGTARHRRIARTRVYPHGTRTPGRTRRECGRRCIDADTDREPQRRETPRGGPRRLLRRAWRNARRGERVLRHAPWHRRDQPPRDPRSTRRNRPHQRRPGAGRDVPDRDRRDGYRRSAPPCCRTRGTRSVSPTRATPA